MLISQLRESGLQVPVGSSLEQYNVARNRTYSVLSGIFNFREKMKLRQRPHKSLIGAKFKFSDEHSLSFHMGAPLGFPNV